MLKREFLTFVEYGEHIASKMMNYDCLQIWSDMQNRLRTEMKMFKEISITVGLRKQKSLNKGAMRMTLCFVFMIVMYDALQTKKNSENFLGCFQQPTLVLSCVEGRRIRFGFINDRWINSKVFHVSYKFKGSLLLKVPFVIDSAVITKINEMLS